MLYPPYPSLPSNESVYELRKSVLFVVFANIKFLQYTIVRGNLQRVARLGQTFLSFPDMNSTRLCLEMCIIYEFGTYR